MEGHRYWNDNGHTEEDTYTLMKVMVWGWKTDKISQAVASVIYNTTPEYEGVY